MVDDTSPVDEASEIDDEASAVDAALIFFDFFFFVVVVPLSNTWPNSLTRDLSTGYFHLAYHSTEQHEVSAIATPRKET